MSYNTKGSAERYGLDAALDANRRAIIEQVDGLSDADSRRRLVPSLTTPIALVKHVAAAERIWFQRFWERLDADACDGYARRDEGTFAVSPTETVRDVIAEFERASQRSRQISSRFDLDDITTVAGEGTITMRATLITMVVELARHAGHADILREQIDAPPRLDHADRDQ